ncbi:hypothetical protein GGR31_000755 [Mesonia maritima]|uniref:Uncharacterized protein n=1 Tax=Mesonia maritima TaxID=1793873 RepID=A0ABU1K3E7_9FLAO|nr:hypothetical protein [Mesonia maritima]
MKKTIFLLIALFVTFNVIGQRLTNKKNTQEVNYSESTPIKVVYKDSVKNGYH